MRKVDFDVGAAARLGARSGFLQEAERIMHKNEHILKTAGVLGMWIGARASKPYIMVAVDEDDGEKLRRTIPDSLDGISVYYIEGKLGH